MSAPVSLQFADPPREALETTHRKFALRAGRAVKYPREVAPFGAVGENSREGFAELISLLEPGEEVYALSEQLPDGVAGVGPFGVVQMTYPAERALPMATDRDEVRLERLSCADAEAMVELTSVAFPEFFRRRTCEMGSYYGIRVDGRLVAMCGERMAIGNYRELSGLCTHPEHRGRGHAQRLMVQLMRDHREAGLRSYLHAAADNPGAIALYERMGFVLRGEFPMCRVWREG